MAGWLSNSGNISLSEAGTVGNDVAISGTNEGLTGSRGSAVSLRRLSWMRPGGGNTQPTSLVALRGLANGLSTSWRQSQSQGVGGQSQLDVRYEGSGAGAFTVTKEDGNSRYKYRWGDFANGSKPSGAIYFNTFQTNKRNNLQADVYGAEATVSKGSGLYIYATAKISLLGYSSALYSGLVASRTSSDLYDQNGQVKVAANTSFTTSSKVVCASLELSHTYFSGGDTNGKFKEMYVNELLMGINRGR